MTNNMPSLFMKGSASPMTLKQLHDHYGSDLCRGCINSLCHAELERNDCLYGNIYPERCDHCGEMRNIVKGLRLSGKLKLLLK